MSDSELAAGAEEDLTLPKATVFKMIKDLLPEEVICAKETRDLILESCVEFIHLLASQSNEICEQTSKKTIGPEHIIQALNQLGYQSFIDEVKQVESEHTTTVKQQRQRKSAAKFNAAGVSQEELLRQQEELFKAARAKYELKMQEQQQEQEQHQEQEPTATSEN